VLFILIGSTVFSLTFQGVGRAGLGGAPVRPVARRREGFPGLRHHRRVPARLFLDFFEIAFILLPLLPPLAPVADKLGIDLV